MQQRNVQGNNPTEGVGSGRVDPSVEAKGAVGTQFQADPGYVGRTGRIDSSPTDCNIQTLTVVPIAAERNKVATLAVAIDKGEIGNALERDPAEVRRANVLVLPVMGTPRVIKTVGAGTVPYNRLIRLGFGASNEEGISCVVAGTSALACPLLSS